MKLPVSLILLYSIAYKIPLLLITNQPLYQTELYRFFVLIRYLGTLAVLFMVK